MPIAELEPEVSFVPKPELPKAQPDNYMGLTYDDKQEPLVSLQAYVEGAPWEVTYFPQVLGAHNDLKELDPGLSPQYQAYTRIEKMELRLDDSINGQTDSTTQRTSANGTALVYAFMIPNVNDYFISNTSMQRTALFRVTNVNRHTWRRESIHTIEFTMVDYIERIPQEIESLKLKTTATYVFSRDRLIEGLPTPYLRVEQYQQLVDLKDARERIGTYYLSTFVDNGSKTLLIPGQPFTRAYDPFLTQFVLSTFGYMEFPRCYELTQLPNNGDPYLNQPQFWEAIIRADRNLINYGNKQMKVATTTSFLHTTYVKSIYSARIDAIVYPWKPDLSAISGDTDEPIIPYDECLKPTTGASGQMPTVEQSTYVIDDKRIPAYPPGHVNGYYVLGRAFYLDVAEELTLLELMTRDYLAGKPLDLNQVTFMANIYITMPRLEQFYYGPLIMALMKYADRRMY